jgi:ribonuclease-3
MVDIDLKTLALRLGHEFDDHGLLKLAITHRSHGASNNERLEFLGDSILNFVIAEDLYRRFPDAREGQLSRLRASLVKGETLATVAVALQLGESLRLGQGESKSGGHSRESILADALEATIGAIYLDRGLEPARECILSWYDQRLAGLSLKNTAKDPKTRLQELLQAQQQGLPEYQLEKVEGQAHEQRFTVSCRSKLLAQPCLGTGRSRRYAEQQAAHRALELLQEKQPSV